MWVAGSCSACRYLMFANDIVLKASLEPSKWGRGQRLCIAYRRTNCFYR